MDGFIPAFDPTYRITMEDIMLATSGLTLNELERERDNYENYPKLSKNWCDLPSELKKEVIQYIDYRSSVNLRQTAHAEKDLVDSREHFNFKAVKLSCDQRDEEYLEVTHPDGNKFRVYRENGVKYNAVVAHVLKVGNIVHLIVDSSHAWMVTAMDQVEKIRAKSLILNSFCFEKFDINFGEFLEKCDGLFSLVSIMNPCDCNCFYNPNQQARRRMHQMVLKTKFFMICRPEDSAKCWKNIKSFQAMNPEVGTVFTCNIKNDSQFLLPGTRDRVPPNHKVSTGSSSKIIYCGRQRNKKRDELVMKVEPLSVPDS